MRLSRTSVPLSLPDPLLPLLFGLLDFRTTSSYVLLIDMHARVHIIAEGLVQGVGFRWYAARRAEGLGLKGYVRNLYDGRVEVRAEGDRSLLEELIKDMKIGPRSAHVTNLRLEWHEPSDEFTHFTIR